MIRVTDTLDPLEMLDHAEAVLENYVPVIDKMPIEDKLILAYEEEVAGLSPWEVQEVVQDAMAQLPDGLEEHVDVLFDIIYEAIAEALERTRR